MSFRSPSFWETSNHTLVLPGHWFEWIELSRWRNILQIVGNHTSCPRNGRGPNFVDWSIQTSLLFLLLAYCSQCVFQKRKDKSLAQRIEHKRASNNIRHMLGSEKELNINPNNNNNGVVNGCYPLFSKYSPSLMYMAYYNSMPFPYF